MSNKKEKKPTALQELRTDHDYLENRHKYLKEQYEKLKDLVGSDPIDKKEGWLIGCVVSPRDEHRCPMPSLVKQIETLRAVLAEEQSHIKYAFQRLDLYSEDIGKLRVVNREKEMAERAWRFSPFREVCTWLAIAALGLHAMGVL